MKLFKKDISKKKLKKIASSTYEVIDIVLESPRDILSMTGSGIVGSSMQAQKVSRMIIMINKGHPGIPIDSDIRCMKQYDLMVWDSGENNAYYIAGSMSNFYTMCLSYTLRHLSESFTDFVIHALLEANYMCRDKYAAALFTDKQISCFSSTEIGEPVITSTEKRRKEMMEYIVAGWSIQYDIIPIVINTYDTNKSTIMAMAKFCFIGKDNIIAYVNARQFDTINRLFGNADDTQDDNIATEVIE